MSRLPTTMPRPNTTIISQQLVNNNNTTTTTSQSTPNLLDNNNRGIINMVNNTNTLQTSNSATTLVTTQQTNNPYNNNPTTTTTNTTTTTSLQQSTPPPGSNNNNGPATLFTQQPSQPRQMKPWHEKITTEMRRHLIQKIIQTIFPTQDQKIYSDPRLNNLVNYAVRTECDMYEAAKDQEEYFHLLAERIYKIQKEFEDKQKMQQKTGGGGGGGGGQQQGRAMVGGVGVGGVGGVNNTMIGDTNANLMINSNHNDFQSQLNQLGTVYNPGTRHTKAVFTSISFFYSSFDQIYV